MHKIAAVTPTRSLAPLPIPSLENFVAGVQAWLAPFLSDTAQTELAHGLAAHRGELETAQAQLMAHADQANKAGKSWLEDWWLNSYLSVQPRTTNFGFILNIKPPEPQHDISPQDAQRAYITERLESLITAIKDGMLPDSPADHQLRETSFSRRGISQDGTPTVHRDFSYAIHLAETDLTPQQLMDPLPDEHLNGLTVVIDPQGQVGINFEHSRIDGQTALKIAKWIIKDQLDIRPMPTPANEPYHLLTLLLPTVPRPHQISRDTLCQLAINHTVYQHNPRQPFSTYESVSLMDTFEHGRTEGHISTTAESLLFNKTTDKADLLEAAKANRIRVSDCQKGQGMLRHLFGLRKLLPPDSDAQKFLRSHLFDALDQHLVSTSNCSDKDQLIRAFAFPPTHPHGVGIGYYTSDTQVTFCISANPADRDSRRLKAHLIKTLPTTFETFQALLSS